MPLCLTSINMLISCSVFIGFVLIRWGNISHCETFNLALGIVTVQEIAWFFINSSLQDLFCYKESCQTK